MINGWALDLFKSTSAKLKCNKCYEQFFVVVVLLLLLILLLVCCDFCDSGPVSGHQTNIKEALYTLNIKSIPVCDDVKVWANVRRFA